MMGERPIQTARMLLLAATVVVAFALATAANEQRQVMHYYNGNVVPQATAMANVMDAAVTRVSPLAGGMVQQSADDRSLILPKIIALKALKKHKKHKKQKKNPFKSPFKVFPALFPLFGGAAIASAATAATTAAAANGAKGVAAIPSSVSGPATFTAPVPDNIDIPVWKVHKYNGIDIRPVRLSEIVPLPPPSEITEYKEVINEAPKEVNGPPPGTYPTPSDTVVFPENPSPPAQSYGVPAQTYGVPAQTYGVPAQTYGVPAQTYGVPAQNYGVPVETYNVPSYLTYAVPSQPIPVSTPEEIAPPADEAATAESLEALSNLGALTDLIPGGGDSSSLLPSLFGVGGAASPNRGVPFSFFNRFIRGPQSAAQVAEASVEDSSLRQPAQSSIQNLLGRIPIISSLTNFGNVNPATHVNIPPLPELPALPDIQNVRGPNVQIPQIPHIRLPTKYVVRGSPYISIRTPYQTAATPLNEVPPALTPEPVVQTEAPAVEPLKPETSYPLPLEQPQPLPQSQFGLVNSYGQPVQTGYYVTPVISAPAPPQFAVPLYPSPVAGTPASQYGLPGGDSAPAASEVDPATVTECGDDKACAKGVMKVVVPEGVTRKVSKSQAPATPSPVFKKNDVKEVPLEDMTKYLDPRHVAATKSHSSSPVVEGVDAQPSTNTDADEEESS